MYRLFKSQRICKASDFARFRSNQARSRIFGTLVLKIVERIPSGDCSLAPLPRLGIITSKKVGNAVARNRVRRIIRENFRLNPKIFRADSDYLFIALRGISDKSNKKIGEEVLNAATKFARGANFVQKDSTAIGKNDNFQ
ncbi:MAG: ribonuclease P protein component [Puniceicoccales bacterium]|jgi:ribonuclease P protein component|nr:ribonuclease P protein component [Puniceicoccales bacterium]